MATFDREYAGAAPPTTLSAPITNASPTDGATFATSGSVDVSNYPDANFVVVIDRGVASKEEKIFCSTRVGTTFTVGASGRGFDGTTAVGHAAGATVEHIYDAASASRLVQHINDEELDDHPQYLNVERHDVTTRHPGGTVVPVGNPGSIVPGDTPNGGTGTDLILSNHRHGMLPWGITADLSPALPDTVAAQGTDDTYARGDHAHAGPGYGTVTELADVAAVEVAGVSPLVARADHVHALPPLLVASSVAVTHTNYSGGGLGVDLTNQHTRGSAPTCTSHTFTIARAGQIALIFGVLDLEIISFAAAAGTVLVGDLYVDGTLYANADNEQIIAGVNPAANHDRYTLSRMWALTDLTAASHTVSLRAWWTATGNSAFARPESGIHSILLG